GGLVGALSGANGSPESLGLVGWQADRMPRLTERLEDALADPPYGIADELEAAGVIEALHSRDQAQVAFVDEVAQGHTSAGITHRHTHYEPKVGLHQAIAGARRAGAHELG